MKQIIIAGLLLGAAHGAQAQPYVNAEVNQAFGSNTLTELHVGWEGGANGASYFIQGGPAVDSTSGEVSNIFTAKMGGEVHDVGVHGLDFYGELGLSTGPSTGYAAKAGVKYHFH